MQGINGYAQAKAATGATEKLPVGGYICKVKQAKVEPYDGYSVLVLAFDIVEGEYSGFYQKNFDNQTQDKKWKGTVRQFLPKGDKTDKDNLTISILKGITTSIEKSNGGISIDLSKEWEPIIFKDKLFGGVFGRKEWEYNGDSGFFTECRFVRSTDTIREGKFEIPKDKMLKAKSSNNVQNNPFGNQPDFEEIKANDELPF
jgi:hypothetical protein